MRLTEIIPVYVDSVPKVKEYGKLYISKKHKVAIHMCACGCCDHEGREVVTPLDDNRGWKLTDNNGNVTMRPSIGNWSGERPYHAHYYITNNKIQWL